MPPALTQRHLASLGCGMPDCDHDHSVLYFVGRCHPKAGVEAKYTKTEGTLEITCKTCKRPIASVLVAAQ